MKKQIFLPFSFLFSIIVASCLLGAILGSVSTWILLYRNSATIPKLFDLDKDKNYKEQLVLVTKVIDGDTIDVQNNKDNFRVRYLGIDAPEDKGDANPAYYAKEAAEKNKALVEGKKVLLVWDSTQTHSKRLLAFVYVGDTFVNAELLKGGYASLFKRDPKDHIMKHRYSNLFAELEQSARVNGLGIWNLKAKYLWDKEHNLQVTDQPSMYIADVEIFHRPECPKVAEIKEFRCFYYYTRDFAIRDGRVPCTLCKP